MVNKNLDVKKVDFCSKVEEVEEPINVVAVFIVAVQWVGLSLFIPGSIPLLLNILIGFFILFGFVSWAYEETKEKEIYKNIDELRKKINEQ